MAKTVSSTNVLGKLDSYMLKKKKKELDHSFTIISKVSSKRIKDLNDTRHYTTPGGKTEHALKLIYNTIFQSISLE